MMQDERFYFINCFISKIAFYKELLKSGACCKID